MPFPININMGQRLAWTQLEMSPQGGSVEPKAQLNNVQC